MITFGLLAAAAVVIIPMLVSGWLRTHFPEVHETLAWVLGAVVVIAVIGVVFHGIWEGMGPAARKWTVIVGCTLGVILALLAIAIVIIVRDSVAFLGHIWSAIMNTIVVIIVLLLFRAAYSRFEVIVVAALTLIYLAVTSGTARLSRVSGEAAQRSVAQFIQLARLLNDPACSVYEAQLHEQAQAWASARTQYYINAVFSAVLWLIAMWKLLSVTIAA